MIRWSPAGSRLAFWGVYCAGLVGYAWFNSGSLERLAIQAGLSPRFWDSVLTATSSPYVFSYWMMPFAMWAAVVQVRGHSRAEEMIRCGTKSDWSVRQGVLALRWILPMVGASSVTAILWALQYPFDWEWSPLSGASRITDQYPVLLPDLPIPALVICLQVVATSSTFVALTMGVAATASTLRHTWLPGLVAGGVFLWTGMSFRSAGWLFENLGPGTYALPYLAQANLRLGPGGAIPVLAVASSGIYVAARWWEARGHSVLVVSRELPRRLLVCLAGVAVLTGLASLQGGVDGTGVLIRSVLQGVGTETLSIVALLATIILALAPTIVVFSALVEALSGRRYAEMVRMGSPVRWFAGRLFRAVPLVVVYALVLGLWMALLSFVVGSGLPDPASGVLVVLWAVALALQVLVYVLMLVIGTAFFRRVEGAGYAVGAAVALALPLGEAARFSPSGQASLLRFTDLSVAEAPVTVLPLAVLAGWLVVFGAIAVVLIRRTRGEIL